MPKLITISPEALSELPWDFHIISQVYNEKGMDGENHEVCVKVSWTENFPSSHPRTAIFDAITGEYLTDCA